MPITLSILEGPHAGAVFNFEGHDTFLVGRAPEAHFHLPDDPYFSRLHLLIELNPPLCRLIDLGSRNGTLVNDAKVQSTTLGHGDRIRAGRTLFLIAITKESVAATLDLPAVQQVVTPIPHTLRPDSPHAMERTTLPISKALKAPSIPGYAIQAQLGEGGMGAVYRAVDQKSGKVVALKTIKPAVAPSDVVLGRFLREARILQELSHPNIVAFHDMGSVDGLLYFAMEFVAGTDAEKIVEQSRPMPIRQAVEIMAEVLTGLAYAHGKGFVHRDIKPANLLIVEKDGRTTAKIADFGLARTYETSAMSGLTMSNVSAGTPLFMPPEQVTDFRSVKPAADQYSAAATLYYLLTGHGPHQATRREDLFKKILLEEPTPLRSRRPEVPAALEKAVHRALSRKAEQRFADVGTFRKAIEGAG